MSKVTHVIVELNMPTDTKWFRPDINDEYWGEGKPLIMCKDCKYHINGECEMWDYISTADDYWCKDGERKEEEE